jgi:hypothetical protein
MAMKQKNKIHEQAAECPIIEPGRSRPNQDKPVLSIGSGLLRIEDCIFNHVTLDLESAKELHRLLPGLILILERIGDGD